MCVHNKHYEGLKTLVDQLFGLVVWSSELHTETPKTDTDSGTQVYAILPQGIMKPRQDTHSYDRGGWKHAIISTSSKSCRPRIRKSRDSSAGRSSCSRLKKIVRVSASGARQRTSHSRTNNFFSIPCTGFRGPLLGATPDRPIKTLGKNLQAESS